jgi:hypothetical protein
MRGTVTIKMRDDETRTHIAGGESDYYSICGLAGEAINPDDNQDMNMNGGFVVGHDLHGKKIDCESCRNLWDICKGITNKHRQVDRQQLTAPKRCERRS